MPLFLCSAEEARKKKLCEEQLYEYKEPEQWTNMIPWRVPDTEKDRGRGEIPAKLMQVTYNRLTRIGWKTLSLNCTPYNCYDQPHFLAHVQTKKFLRLSVSPATHALIQGIPLPLQSQMDSDSKPTVTFTRTFTLQAIKPENKHKNVNLWHVD